MSKKIRKAPRVHHITLVIRELEAQVPQRDGAAQVHTRALRSTGFHDMAHTLGHYHLAQDVVAQWADRGFPVGQRGAAQVQLGVHIHLDEDEALHGDREVAGAQEMINGQGLAGRGARRVGARAGERCRSSASFRIKRTPS